MTGFSLGAVGLLAALTLQAAPQDPRNPPESRVGDVIVRGDAGDPVRRFVDGLTQPGIRGRFEGQVARWADPLCVTVLGSDRAVNDELAGRVTLAVQSMNVMTAGPGCAANAVIIMSDDADDLARDIVDRYRWRLFDNRSRAMADFVGPSRAIRWRHNTSIGPVRAGPLVDSLQGWETVAGGALPNTRLKVSTASHIDQAIVIIDRNQVDYATTEALVAYLALALLIDLPAGAGDSGHDTILNLFTEDPSLVLPTGLTDWDRAFVRAVYGVGPDQRFGVQQAEIARSMRRTLDRSKAAER